MGPLLTQRHRHRSPCLCLWPSFYTKRHKSSAAYGEELGLHGEDELAVFAGRDDRGGGIDAAEDFIGGRAVGGVRDVEEEGKGEGGAEVVFEGDGILIKGHFEG